MNFETSAREFASQAMDAWKVLETLYQGGITNGDDLFAKHASALKSLGETVISESELAKSEIVFQELKRCRTFGTRQSLDFALGGPSQS